MNETHCQGVSLVIKQAGLPCPACGGVRLRKYRSLADQGDGSALWWVRCVGCDHRFRVVLE